jgi:hypothetical protein
MNTKAQEPSTLLEICLKAAVAALPEYDRITGEEPHLPSTSLTLRTVTLISWMS